MWHRKKDIINALFILAFPSYGIGKYIAQVGNFSMGQVIAVLPSILIILFYLVDVLYRREIKWRLGAGYMLLLTFCVLSVMSLGMAYRNSIPGVNGINSATLSFFVLVFVHSPLVVHLYNDDEDFSIEHLLYLGLTLDVFINLAGYAMGLKNAVHAIEGRLNLPFGQGFYAAANTVAILNLLIMGKLLRGVESSDFKTWLWFQLILNGILMVGFNSRLSIMTFIFITVMLLVRAWKFHRTIYFISLFTLPLLLNFTELIYQILQLPVFRALLKRVRYEDVTGFNGRRDLWEKGLEWISTQGKGFLFGNGYRGHYAIGLLDDLERFWFKSSVNMHMHSSFLEFLLSVGITGVGLLLIMVYRGVNQIAHRAQENHRDIILMGVVLYLLFVFQIDNYVYMFNYGSFILITIIASSLITENSPVKSYGKPSYFNRNPLL